MASLTFLKAGTMPMSEKANKRDFAELYRAHVDQVYGYLLARTGNVQDAQDLTTQTFVAALEGIKTFRGDGSFAAWVLGIARRKSADHFRTRKNIVSLDDAEMVAYPTPSPEDMVQQQLQMERVAHVLGTMSAERAEALTLYIFGSLRIEEVATMMGKSEGAVKMLIHRALQELRQRLGA